MLLRYFCFLSVLLTFVNSCKKEDDKAVDFHYDYLPLDSGRYVIYNVDSIVYRYAAPQQFRDSIKYQLMELITDTFYDLDNRLNYKIEHFRRADENSSWVFVKVFYCYKSASNFQRVEDDIRFVKLVFPVTENSKWDGNLYAPNTSQFEYLNDWEYTYENANIPYSLNSLNFDSSCSVLEKDEENLIEKTISRNIYAKNVGLVFKEWEMLKAAGTGVVTNWQTGNMEGFRIRWQVIEYGKI